MWCFTTRAGGGIGNGRCTLCGLRGNQGSRDAWIIRPEIHGELHRWFRFHLNQHCPGTCFYSSVANRGVPIEVDTAIINLGIGHDCIKLVRSQALVDTTNDLGDKLLVVKRERPAPLPLALASFGMTCEGATPSKGAETCEGAAPSKGAEQRSTKEKLAGANAGREANK